MSLLLDTHVLVWASEGTNDLGKKTKALLLRESEQLFVSSITMLELARLATARHLQFSSPIEHWYERAKRALGALPVAMDDAIAREAYSLPGVFHADAADRILVATARVHSLGLITADARILKYRGVTSHDARK